MNDAVCDSSSPALTGEQSAHTEDFAAMDNGRCSCGHDVLDHGHIDDGNGWEASPCRLCTCLDSDWGEPSISFRDEARKALGRALDADLLRSEDTA